MCELAKKGFAMDVKPLLQFLLTGSFKLLIEVVEGTTDEEWKVRPFPGANLVGFTIWHCARTIDWAVNRVLRGSPELADLAEWRDLNVAGGRVRRRGIQGCRGQSCAGCASNKSARVRQRRSHGCTLVARRRVARGIVRRNRPQDESRGEGRVHDSAGMGRAQDLDGIPKWQFLARPCVSHIRVHYGEVRSQLEAVRAAAQA